MKRSADSAATTAALSIPYIRRCANTQSRIRSLWSFGLLYILHRLIYCIGGPPVCCRRSCNTDPPPENDNIATRISYSSSVLLLLSFFPSIALPSFLFPLFFSLLILIGVYIKGVGRRRRRPPHLSFCSTYIYIYIYMLGDGFSFVDCY